MRTPIVLAILLLASGIPLTATGAPTPGTDPTCGLGSPVTANHGAGDPQLPTLQYASLKTGFRAVIAWETAESEAARLRYSLDDGATVQLTELVASKFHLFVIDGLPIGRSLCFTPLHSTGQPAGSLHAFRTQNAMNAHDGESYVANFLVLANQIPDRNAIGLGMDEFAAKLYDSTDGHVRAGRIIVVYQDLRNDNSGWATCYIFSLNGGPVCKHLYDVIFTLDYPKGIGVGITLAATYLDGIQEPRDAVWMNLVAQGGIVTAIGGDVAGVLMHEMGHYVFGAQDLYGPDGAGPNCWDPVTEISIMGNEFGATEFDDELHRCPPGSLVPGQGPYEPSYTRLRQRFPLVPDRASIDPGPIGTGAGYARGEFIVVPTANDPPAIPEPAQDDAGSGDDAGNHIVSATPIQPGILYQGTLLAPVDGADVYRFHAPAGAAIEVAMIPRVGCFDLMRADGSSVPGSCVNDGLAAKRTTVGTGEPLFIRFALGDPPLYQFGVGIDAPAPGLL